MPLSSVSFFCPAYHDEKSLPLLIPRVVDFLSRVSAVFEIIIINDGSPDGTGRVADTLAVQYPTVRVIHHSANRGYGAALKTGFRAAQYDYVMYTDGDCQYDIAEFEPYLPLLSRADILSGFVRKKAVTFMRVIQSVVYNALVFLLFGVRFRDINCSMKLYSRAVIDTIDIRSDSPFIDAEMLIRAKRAGFSIAQFPVTHYPRLHGVAHGSRPSVIAATAIDMLKFRFGLL